MSLLRLIHTGDMHGHLTRAGAETLRSLRLEADLLLDSGDAVRCGNVFFNPFGERAHLLMNRAGYDAGCVGNREYHINRYAMTCKLKRARFPFVSANFCWSEGRMFDEYVRFVIRHTEVFVFGLSNVNVSKDMKIARYAHQYQTDPAERAERIILEFEQSPAAEYTRVFIALSHLGLESDKEIARRLEGRIDLILGGHSHDACYGEVRGT
ncbi:MAG: metallophosphoesterase, partial [Abditibacteriota bacterium]|nr:metallophosphoesterase [Abditibacteriota bacterium]